MQVTINRVQNGYIVYGTLRPSHATSEDADTHVFETFKSMTAFLSETMPLKEVEDG